MSKNRRAMSAISEEKERKSPKVCMGSGMGNVSAMLAQDGQHTCGRLGLLQMRGGSFRQTPHALHPLNVSGETSVLISAFRCALPQFGGQQAACRLPQFRGQQRWQQPLMQHRNSSPLRAPACALEPALLLRSREALQYSASSAGGQAAPGTCLFGLFSGRCCGRLRLLTQLLVLGRMQCYKAKSRSPSVIVMCGRAGRPTRPPSWAVRLPLPQRPPPASAPSPPLQPCPDRSCVGRPASPLCRRLWGPAGPSAACISKMLCQTCRQANCTCALYFSKIHLSPQLLSSALPEQQRHASLAILNRVYKPLRATHKLTLRHHSPIGCMRHTCG